MLITIGKVLKPFGVRGEVKVEPLTDFPERFTGLSQVYLTSPVGKQVPCTVKSVRYAGKTPLLVIEGYDTPEKVKTLSGWYVQIPEKDAVPLPEGSYYWFELIGMDVRSEAGEKIGTITEVFQTGSNDVYVVKRGGAEVYIPATQEVVKQVDKKSRTMVIHLMEGLLD
jgi:16S rRNA processing protein RimM